MWYSKRFPDSHATMNKSQDDSVGTTADFLSRLQQALAVATVRHLYLIWRRTCTCLQAPADLSTLPPPPQEPSPDAEPFKNHYAARDLFHALLTSPLSPFVRCSPDALVVIRTIAHRISLLYSAARAVGGSARAREARSDALARRGASQYAHSFVSKHQTTGSELLVGT